MKFCLSLIVLFIIIASCNQVQKTEISEAPRLDTIYQQQSTYNFRPKIADTTIINNQFINQFRNLQIEDLQKNALISFSISKKPTENRHVDNVMDTIVTLTAEKEAILFEFYKSTTEIFLINTTLASSAFELQNGIKVTMNQDSFLKALRLLQFSGNSVKITDSDEMNAFWIVFADRKIQKIWYEGYLD